MPTLGADDHSRKPGWIMAGPQLRVVQLRVARTSGCPRRPVDLTLAPRVVTASPVAFLAADQIELTGQTGSDLPVPFLTQPRHDRTRQTLPGRRGRPVRHSPVPVPVDQYQIPFFTAFFAVPLVVLGSLAIFVGGASYDGSIAEENRETCWGTGVYESERIEFGGSRGLPPTGRGGRCRRVCAAHEPATGGRVPNRCRVPLARGRPGRMDAAAGQSRTGKILGRNGPRHHEH
jgi:hypothetical protein